MRTVIFDLDGTLADTSADLIAAANACFVRLGHGALLDPVTDAATAFRGGRAMLRLGFSRLGDWTEAMVAAEYQPLLVAYERDIDRHTVLYPGAIAAIEALRADGFATGICTNKPERLAEALMTRLGVRGLFGSLVGAGTLALAKPHAAPYLASVERAGGTLARSMLVGDTTTDVETGRAAGVPVALVTFGPAGRAVADLQPEALLDSFAALPGLARQLLGAAP